MSELKPFKLNVSEETLNYIKKRVSSYPWHEMPNDGGWDYGTNIDYLKNFCEYWVEEFDWKAQEEQINKFSNFRGLNDQTQILPQSSFKLSLVFLRALVAAIKV